MSFWLEKTNSINDKSCGVYKIYNIYSNKTYIGISTDLKLRLKKHYHTLCNNAHHNKHLQNSVNAYGIDSFDFEILELLPYNIQDEELLKKESEYQLSYRSCDHEYGYNIKVTDSNGIVRHTEEFKEKVRLLMTGRIVSEQTKFLLSKKLTGRKGKKHTKEFKEKMSKRMANRTFSKETREKLSRARMGRPSPLKGRVGHKAAPETKAKMSAGRKGALNCRAVKIIDNNGNIYLTIKEAAEKLHISRSTVQKYLKSGRFQRKPQ
jgi:group I intron endonuclease